MGTKLPTHLRLQPHLPVLVLLFECLELEILVGGDAAVFVFVDSVVVVRRGVQRGQRREEYGSDEPDDGVHGLIHFFGAVGSALIHARLKA